MLKNVTISEIDLNRPPIRQCAASGVALTSNAECGARTPEMIIDTWTHDIKLVYDRLCAASSDAKVPHSMGDIDDGAFPDLLFA